MSAIVRNECYKENLRFSFNLSLKGGGSVAPYIPHLFICIKSLLLQAAIAHVAHSLVGTKGNLRFPFNPSLQLWATGQRGQQFESHQSRCKFSVQLKRHGAEAARAAHNREVTRSKRVVGISSSHRIGA